MIISLFIVLNGCFLYALLKPSKTADEEKTKNSYTFTPASISSEAKKNA